MLETFIEGNEDDNVEEGVAEEAEGTTKLFKLLKATGLVGSWIA